jgi:hypothetical protein
MIHTKGLLLDHEGEHLKRLVITTIETAIRWTIGGIPVRKAGHCSQRSARSWYSKVKVNAPYDAR